MQDRDAEDRHDGRADLCDHGRAHWSDLGDQGEEEEERDRRAHDCKHCHRPDDGQARQNVLPVGHLNGYKRRRGIITGANCALSTRTSACS